MAVGVLVAMTLAIAQVSVADGQDTLRTVASPDAASDLRRTERDALFRSCESSDRTAPATVAGAQSRADCWQRMQVQGMGDDEVATKFAAALVAVDSARVREENEKKKDSAAEEINRKLQLANSAIRARDLDDAASIVDDILAVEPNNQRALLYRDRIASLRARRDQLRTLAVLVGAAVVLIAGLAVFARHLRKRQVEGATMRAAEDAKRKAVLKVVEGVGRGRLASLEGDVFRIGAAQSDSPELRNDLVLSDAEALISRFHCAVFRKEGRFYLVDSSTNGTAVNGRPVEAGKQVALRDGDEVEVAGVSRLAFLRM